MEPNNELPLNTPVEMPRQDGYPLFSVVVRREVRERKESKSVDGHKIVQQAGEWFSFELFCQEDQNPIPTLMSAISIPEREPAIAYMKTLLDPIDAEGMNDGIKAIYHFYKEATRISEFRRNPDWKD